MFAWPHHRMRRAHGIGADGEAHAALVLAARRTAVRDAGDRAQHRELGAWRFLAFGGFEVAPAVLLVIRRHLETTFKLALSLLCTATRRLNGGWIIRQLGPSPLEYGRCTYGGTAVGALARAAGEGRHGCGVSKSWWLSAPVPPMVRTLAVKGDQPRTLLVRSTPISCAIAWGSHLGPPHTAGDHALSLHCVHLAHLLAPERVAAAAHVRAALDGTVHHAVGRADHDVPRAVSRCAPAPRRAEPRTRSTRERSNPSQGSEDTKTSASRVLKGRQCGQARALGDCWVATLAGSPPGWKPHTNVWVKIHCRAPQRAQMRVPFNGAELRFLVLLWGLAACGVRRGCRLLVLMHAAPHPSS